MIWPVLMVLAAPGPTCKAADRRVEAVIETKVRATGGTEYCQDRLYHTVDDLDGDGREDFVVVFSVETSGGDDLAQFLAVFPSATQWKPLVLKVGQTGERYVDEIQVDDDHVLVLLTSEFEPGDAACCPSGEGELLYRVARGRITPAPPTPDTPPAKRS
jgi:hypothetical protein